MILCHDRGVYLQGNATVCCHETPFSIRLPGPMVLPRAIIIHN